MCSGGTRVSTRVLTTKPKFSTLATPECALEVTGYIPEYDQNNEVWYPGIAYCTLGVLGYMLVYSQSNPVWYSGTPEYSLEESRYIPDYDRCNLVWYPDRPEFTQLYPTEHTFQPLLFFQLQSNFKFLASNVRLWVWLKPPPHNFLGRCLEFLPPG